MKYQSVLLYVVNIFISAVIGIHWDHSTYLNEDFRLLWTIKMQDITFEVQVRTLGYVGLGFSLDGNQRSAADIAIGWIDQGKSYFQVIYTKFSF